MIIWEKIAFFLVSCQFYCNGKDGYDEYIGELPCKVSFNKSIDEFIRLLGS